jgi:hypothetical protein
MIAMKHASSSEILATCSTSRLNVVDGEGENDCIAWWWIWLQHEIMYRCVVVDQSIRISHKQGNEWLCQSRCRQRKSKLLRAVTIG